MSIADASGGTGRRLARSRPSRLAQRVASALALGPVPVAAIWFESPWLPLVTAAAAAVMAWEWERLVHRAPGNTAERGDVRLALVAVVLAPLAVAALADAASALAVALVGAAAVWALARAAGKSEPHWVALGALWVAVPCVALLWLAGAAAAGRATLLWVLALVWATDIGAYAFGSTFGGPRLAPRWSPRKTWSGLAGGVFSAALVGTATAHILGRASLWPLALVSGGLAVVEQMGDLAESLAKRRFGAKDSSGLIPGHGGLFDRLDGLLAVLPAVALVTWLGGRNLLAWP
jgi:phosphatidate cytidylyltransferase